MAKRKTPKKEKIVALKPEKINEQELSQLQATIKTVDQLTNDVGRMEVRKYALMKAMENMQRRVESMREDFKKKYGTDNINIQDGTISYENTNPEENGEVNKED